MKIKDIRKFLNNNLTSLLDNGTFCAMVAERLAADMFGGEFVNAEGFDYYHKKFGRVEVKSTSKIQNGTVLRICAYQGKRKKFDHIHIVDVVSGRQFVIPHNVFFKHVGKKSEFRWSASYNESDKVMIDNTNLLLEYEYVWSL